MKKTYNPIKQCVYCGATRFASDSKRDLAPEHIIPLGLNGDLIIPEASCRSCERITGRQESIMLKGALQGIRCFLNFRTRNPKDRPKVLPLFWGTNGKTLVDVNDFPAVFFFIRLSLPRILGGPQEGTIIPVLHLLRMDINLIKRKYGLKEFATPSTDVQAFFRMLAKIGHSFAVAELGLDSFKPSLVEYILSKDYLPRLDSHIGGSPEEALITNELHEIEIYKDELYPDLTIVRIRLFAKYGGPPYLVVVGEKK